MANHNNPNNQSNNQQPARHHEQIENYRRLIRLGAIAGGIALWVVSARFNIAGFDFHMPGFVWVGIILAFAITVIEVVFTEEGWNHSLTLIVAGGMAYAYGIYTNITGVMQAQGLIGLDLNLESLFVCTLGFMLEVVPEALFTWGVTGIKGKDFLSSLLLPVVGQPNKNNNQGGGKHSHHNNQNQGQHQKQGGGSP